MEERSDGILLRPRGSASVKLSWEETARDMAAQGEDWSDWNAVNADGLDQVPWADGKTAKVAEPAPPDPAPRSRRKR